MNFDLEAVEGYVANHLRVFIFMTIGLLVLVGMVAALVFFISVRGAEQTLVPDVQGKELTAALIELQSKELYPRLTLRHTQTNADRGLILEQTPPPGTIVKAGRRIQLVVSQGAVVNTVENYIGRNVDQVRMDIQTMFMPQGPGLPPLLSLREPLMYEFSHEPAGTVLQQRPEPGTQISTTTTLDLVVSRGAEGLILRLPNLIGLGMEDALEQIGRLGIDFEFIILPPGSGEKPETIIAQNPPGDTLAASETRVQFTIAAPNVVGANEVFGFFVFDMARNPYPLLVRLESIQPGGERVRLLSAQHPGGRLTVPYRQPHGSILVLSMLNREIHRETVMPFSR